MKVGVLGTGDVGHALGNGFIDLGHEVMMGARHRNNDKAAAWVARAGAKASAGTFADAAHFGDLVVLATLGTVAEAVLNQAGAANLKGKVLWDATNPLDHTDGLKLAITGYDSLGERVQKWAPEARVVKVFNTVGNALMYKPRLEGGPPTMFIAGNDDGAKGRTAALLKDFGWQTCDIGGIAGSRYLEAMCIVWVMHGMQSGSWKHAFKLLQ